MVERVSALSVPLPQGNILGFDFGTKRIGVAVGQAITQTATPLAPLAALDGVPDWQVLQTLLNHWRPQALVVGLPLNMDGTEQRITWLTRKFIQALRDKTQLPLYEVDERLTTVEARSQLFEKGGYSSLKKESIDSFAAKLILEHWLRG